jgi:hypothetical protein
MTAIVTDKIKKLFLEGLFEDFDSAGTNYYAAIGRSEDWNSEDTVVTPLANGRDEIKARLQLQSIKSITDKTFAIPRYNWSSGTLYSQFDDIHVGYPTNPYYVMNSNQEVYICLQQGKDATGTAQVSTIQPTGNTTGRPFRTADDYVWKFLYSIGALNASKFLSSAYMPVQFIDSDTAASEDASAEQVEQRAVELAAIPGQLSGVAVKTTGSGYTTDPTVEVIGDGTGAYVEPVVSGDAVVNYVIKRDSAENLNGTNPASYASLPADQRSFRGHGYTRASLKITGVGQGATGRVILGPPNGLGADPRDDLKSRAVMFNSKIEGEEEGDFIIGTNTFRQVMLYRNPLVSDYDSAEDFFTESTGRGLDAIEFTGTSGTFEADKKISAPSGATAYVDHVDSINGNILTARLFVHQGESDGFTPFQVGDAVSDPSSNTGTVSAILKGDFDPFTGELLYIDNRAAVDRSAEQTEDLKIVIQL